MRLKIAHLLLFTTISFNYARVLGSDSSWNDFVGQRGPNESLYECRFTYFPLPPSWTRIILHHLVPLTTPKELAEDTEQEVVLTQRLSYDSTSSEIDLSSIDPNLPFTFFIHGFNQNCKYRTHSISRVAIWFSGKSNALEPPLISRNHQ